jgi:hypothetical protein
MILSSNPELSEVIDIPNHKEEKSETLILQTPKNVVPSTKWHDATEILNIITNKEHLFVHTEVPPGNKSNCYMLVDNSRNIVNIERKGKCEFFDDIGVWDSSKGNTVKSTVLG